MNDFTSPIQHNENLNIEKNQKTSIDKSPTPTTHFEGEQKVQEYPRNLKMKIILEEPSLKKKKFRWMKYLPQEDLKDNINFQIDLLIQR